jgi:hypothetical protein
MNNKSVFRIILSLLIIVGFFLPFFKGSVTGLDFAKAVVSPGDIKTKLVCAAFALPALFALIVFLQSIGRRGSSFLIRFLPFLIIAILSAIYVMGVNLEYGPHRASDFFSEIGIGYILTAVGSFLLMLV